MSKRFAFATATLPALCAGLLLFSGQAIAQGEPEPEAPAEGEPADDSVELEEEGVTEDEDSYEFGETGDENPTDPNSSFAAQENKGEAEVATPAKDKGYPTRSIDRPLNLPGATSEISLNVPVLVKPFAIGGTLRGTYGITSEMQVGLRYNMGAFSSDGFAVGKAVSLDTQYQFTKNIAGQISIPMFLDPFAVGLVLGAPMKFAFFDSFALVFGENLVSIKLHEFFPSLENAGRNAAFISDLDDGTITPLWLGNASVRAIYQMDDKLALDAQLGTQFDDTNAAATVHMNVGALLVHKENLDLGARLGAGSLSSFVDTLGVSVFVNFRI